ncbi:MAG: MBL fold metallo-hydrolase [Planctomycetota bacterium]|nr:MBL fold metallo-hydrolase [Planctomycetota bacterium]
MPSEQSGRSRSGAEATGVSVRGFELGPFQTNCYVVSEPGGGCWIVDAGFDPGELIDWIRGADLRPQLVILTHAHIDHIAGLDEVRRAFAGVPVVIHAAEAGFLGDARLNLSAALGEPFETGGPDRTLAEGDELTLGDSRWRVLHTPGHSPGGVALVCEALGLALVGDTLFAGSIGRHDFPTSDGPLLVRSIREKLYALDERTRVLPGHGPETSIGREKRSNPFVRGELR